MADQRENSEKSVNINIPNIQTKGPGFRTYTIQYGFLIAIMLIFLITLAIFLKHAHPIAMDATKNKTKIAKIQGSFTNNRINIVRNTEKPVLYPNLEDQTPVYPLDPSINNNRSPSKLKIISRREWLAEPPEFEPTLLQLPVPFVFIMETSTEECTDQATCTFQIRSLQSFHIDSEGLDDISYNFLVGGDGFPYEGRGWGREGAHTSGYNSKSIGIAFVGTFNRTMPEEKQIIAAKQLIHVGVKKGYIKKDFKLLAKIREVGLELYEELQTWPHWTTKL